MKKDEKRKRKAIRQDTIIVIIIRIKQKEERREGNHNQIHDVYFMSCLPYYSHLIKQCCALWKIMK